MELQRHSGSRARFPGGRVAAFCGATVVVLGVSGLFLTGKGSLSPRDWFGSKSEAEDRRSGEGLLSEEPADAPAMRSAAGKERRAALLRGLVAREPARAVTFLERAVQEAPRDA